MKKKRCTKCGKVKPLTEFSKKARAKDGHQAPCKDCANKYHKERREKIKSGEIEKIIRSEKRCPQCKKIKPIDDFCEATGAIDGHSNWCKDCENKKGKERREGIRSGEIKKIIRSEKRCPQCKKIKPIDDFIKESGRIDGHQAPCKDCANKYHKERREKIRKGVIKKIIRLEKRCPQCKKIKPIEDFNKNTQARDGHGGYCKDCENKNQRESYYENEKEKFITGLEILTSVILKETQNG